MNTKILVALAASAFSLTFVSCTQVQAPKPLNGYPKATPITLDTTDCKLVCGRVSGVAKGVSILGIPFKMPSETTALSNMYQNARDRGCKVEGESVVFANASVERSSQNYILFSRPTIKATGDLVQYVGNSHLNNRTIEVKGGSDDSSSGGGISSMMPF